MARVPDKPHSLLAGDTARSVMRFILSNRRHVGDLLLAGFLVNLLGLSLPLFSMLVYDKAMGNALHDTVWTLAMGMLLLLGLELTVRLLRVYALEHAGARWDALLEERLMQRVVQTPPGQSLPAARILSSLRELAVTRDVITAQGLLIFADVPFAMLFIFLIASIAGPLVFIPLAGIVCVCVLAVLVHRLSTPRIHRSQVLARQRVQRLLDVLSARDSLPGTAWSDMLLRRHRSDALGGARTAARGRWYQQWLVQAFPVLLSSSSVCLLVAGVYQVQAQVLSVGGLISVSMLSARLMSQAGGFVMQWPRWQEFRRALDGLNRGEIPGGTPVSKRMSDVVFNPQAWLAEGLRCVDIGFAWPGSERSLITGFKLQLMPAQLVALLGTNGAGKSTVLRLLAGHLAASRGSLCFAGQVIASDADRQQLMTRVHYAPQLPVFLPGSLREIVSGGHSEPDDARILGALRDAAWGPWLDGGEWGLDSPVDAGGANLSGGQRKLLSLACAFHSAAEILLLDEPTAGLDNSSSQLVIRSIRRLSTTRSILVATHATELASCADRLCVLDGGRIRADGPPEQILSRAASKVKPEEPDGFGGQAGQNPVGTVAGDRVVKKIASADSSVFSAGIGSS